MRLGKHPARHDKRTVMYADVTDATMPDFPMALAQDSFVPEVVDMYDNDKIGDCTCASIGYLENVWTQYGRAGSLLTKDEVIKAYCDVAGYVPGDENTDNGASMLDVLKRWRNIGISNKKILAFVKIDHNNIDHVKSAINMLGGIYVGAMLPNSAKKAVDSGRIWSDVSEEPGTWGGHCMSASRYDRSTIWLRTWGKSQPAEWSWWRRYVDECYGALSPEWRQPNGLNLDRLQLYLSNL